MSVIKGNTAGSILSSPFLRPVKITSYSIVNKTAGAITVSVIIASGLTQTHVNYLSLAANEASLVDVELKVLAGDELLLVTSGSIDYYFNVE